MAGDFANNDLTIDEERAQAEKEHKLEALRRDATLAKSGTKVCFFFVDFSTNGKLPLSSPLNFCVFVVANEYTFKGPAADNQLQPGQVHQLRLTVEKARGFKSSKEVYVKVKLMKAVLKTNAVQARGSAKEQTWNHQVCPLFFFLFFYFFLTCMISAVNFAPVFTVEMCVSFCSRQ